MESEKSTTLVHAAAVWATLRDAKGKDGHLSTEQVTELVRQRAPETSPAHVARALNVLVSRGLLAEVESGGERLYETNLDPHHHFCCRSCGRLIDIDTSEVTALLDVAREGFSVERAEIRFVGLCPSC